MRVIAAIIITAAMYGVIFLISPVADRLLGRPWHAWQVSRHRKRLNERLAAGEDRYFEELRSLEAYDPSRQSPPKKGVLDRLGTVFIFALVTHQIYRILPESF